MQIVSYEQSNTTPSEKNVPIFLPKRAYQILTILKEDYEANALNGGVSQRTKEWYELRFKVSWKSIQNDFAYLAGLGLTRSAPGGKDNPRKRWITCEGYSYLVNYASTYTSTYNSDIPYIDLSEKEMINSLSLEEVQKCEQLGYDELLDNFLKAHMVPQREREQIKSSLNRSRIGPVRTEKIIRGVIAQSKKRFIGNKRNYILKAIQNEEKELAQLFKYFRNKPININMYA